jgi:hypothetical protein
MDPTKLSTIKLHTFRETNAYANKKIRETINTRVVDLEKYATL